MKEQIENAIEWIKEQPIKGCITGSCLLEHFEGQDIDVFVYDEKSFNKILFAMHHNRMFNIMDDLENWKFHQFIDKEDKTYTKFGLVTIKFTYNTCVDINVVFKKKCTNIFSVLSSFDIDVICKGYDIQSGQYLDLTNGSTTSKIASWNKWNTQFSSDEIWDISRILRQLERCLKYHRRGYNTDEVVLKYIELTDNIDRYESIFNSLNFNERLKETKINTNILKDICNVWLAKHEISDDELQLLKDTIKQL